MANKTISINAFDTLFFGNGRPFSKGDETWADGIFPPLPSTIYGALRTAYFAENIQDLNKANTADDPTKDLRITRIYYGIGSDIYFPMPLDLAQKKKKTQAEKDIIKDKKKYSLVQLQLSRLENTHTSSNTILPSKFLTFNEEVEGVENGVISKSVLQKYLHQNLRDLFAHKISDYTQKEAKIGIARTNATKTSTEGNLYRVNMVRPIKEFKIYVEYDFNDNELPKSIPIRLGAENKAAFIKTSSNLIIKIPRITDNIFKIVLTTPAFFENGWYPKILEEEGVILEAACVGKAMDIGGYDLKTKSPKTMRRAVPAGSVYYIKTDNNQVVENLYQRNSVTEEFEGTSYSNQGYGQFYIGKV